jgi:hypothetical protein
MRYLEKVDVVAVKILIHGLTSFSAEAPGEIGAIFYVHVVSSLCVGNVFSIQQIDAHGWNLPQSN